MGLLTIKVQVPPKRNAQSRSFTPNTCPFLTNPHLPLAHPFSMRSAMSSNSFGSVG